MADAPLRSISDTAMMVAFYRAQESARPDAVFRDPQAERLAGERGRKAVAENPFLAKNSWPYVARTHAVNGIVDRHVAGGGDLVLNLAAGLDTRPYWMRLPEALRWVEVDLPETIAYKEDLLRSERPRCRVERVALDLGDLKGRRALFDRLGGSRNALIIAEGLLIYLTPEENLALARDLAATPGFRYYAVDLTSPALMKMLQKRMAGTLEHAGAPLKFAPPEGPDFFRPGGWTPVQVDSLLKVAGGLKRLKFPLSWLAKLPDGKGRNPRQVWGGVCLYERSGGKGGE